MTEPTVSVETSLALLNQKLDQVLDAHAADGTRRDAVSADHETRLRKLEEAAAETSVQTRRNPWLLPAGAGGGGALLGAAGAVLAKALGG